MAGFDGSRKMKYRRLFLEYLQIKSLLIFAFLLGFLAIWGVSKVQQIGKEGLPFAVLSVQAQGTYNVKDYGAKGDGVTDDTSAVQSAIDDCSTSGGGVVLFPRPGTYILNRIYLKDNVTLKLDGIQMEDVVLRGTDESTIAGYIVAEDVNNIGIEGPGTIDRGMGGSEDPAPYWIPYDTWYWKHIIDFNRCNHVTLKDIVVSSENYTVQYCGDQIITSNCTDILYDNVVIRANQEGSSNDSFHITNSGRNITILNSQVFAGDDSLVFHGTLENADYEHVLIQNVTIDGGTVQGAVMLTTGGQNDPEGSFLKDMAFENITVINSLSGWGWGNGISFWPRGANVHYENITFKNWEMLGHVPTPFYGIFSYQGADITGTSAKNIVFENFVIHRTSDHPGQDLEGHGPSVIQNMESVVFRNITFQYSGGELPPDPQDQKLVTFRNIPSLRIGNFRILIDDTPVANPLDYLDFVNCGVTFEEENMEDLDKNGMVDSADVHLCANHILGWSDPRLTGQSDVNQDGEVNILDVQTIVNKLN